MAEPARTDGPSWRALVEAGTDGLWLLDVDGTTVWANRRLGELLGRGDDDLVGLPAAEAFPAEARARVARHLSLLARATRGRDNVAMQVQRDDGTLVPVLVSYAPVREDAAPVRWLHRLTPAP
ncbi:PAS domain-containing protein, partial [uncultured Nocardioides sp.]|uniref:PAS domain-containing protein n=1 Tax=uncultured Nocardioides sp. TaxID=198441 RepID=UPI0030F9EADB